MIRSLLLVLNVALLLTVATSVDAEFYYSSNHEIPIGVDSTRVLVKFVSPLQPHGTSWAGQVGRIDEYLEDNHAIDGFEVLPSLLYRLLLVPGFARYSVQH